MNNIKYSVSNGQMFLCEEQRDNKGDKNEKIIFDC